MHDIPGSQNKVMGDVPFEAVWAWSIFQKWPQEKVTKSSLYCTAVRIFTYSHLQQIFPLSRFAHLQLCLGDLLDKEASRSG